MKPEGETSRPLCPPPKTTYHDCYVRITTVMYLSRPTRFSSRFARYRLPRAARARSMARLLFGLSARRVCVAGRHISSSHRRWHVRVDDSLSVGRQKTAIKVAIAFRGHGIFYPKSAKMGSNMRHIAGHLAWKTSDMVECEISTHTGYSKRRRTRTRKRKKQREHGKQ